MLRANKLHLKQFVKNWYPLILILLLALFLRLWGITHEFPFITHPDEPSVVRSALGLRFEANPKHFDWPHMYFYINYVVYFVFIKFRGLLQTLGLQPFLSANLPLLWQDPLIFYYISRVLSAAIGAFTIIPVFLSARTLFGKQAAYFSALVFTLIPFHVWHSHYALIDVPATFWVAWAFYFSTKIYREDSWKNYLLGGLMIGFAASTKYNGGLLCIVIALAHFFRIIESHPTSLVGKVLKTLGFSKEEKAFSLSEISKLVLSGLTAFLGFVIGTPYALFDYKNFSRTDGPIGAYWQFTNVGKTDFPEHLQNLWSMFTHQLPNDFGYTFFYIFLAAAVYVAYLTFLKRQPISYPLYLVSLPALFLIYYISGFDKTRSHYFMPSFPFVAVTVGITLSVLYELFVKKYKNLTYFFVVLVFAFPLYFSIQNSFIFSRPSTRNLLHTFLKENIQESDLLIYDSSSLLPVLEKFSKNEITKKSEIEINESMHGYVILSLSDRELATLESSDNQYMSLISKNNMTFIDMYVPHYRIGSNILVYSF